MVTNSHIWQALYTSDNHTDISIHTFYICCELFGILFSSSHICYFVNYLNNPIVHSVLCVCARTSLWLCNKPNVKSLWHGFTHKVYGNDISQQQMNVRSQQTHTNAFLFYFYFIFCQLKYAQHHQCFEQDSSQSQKFTMSIQQVNNLSEKIANKKKPANFLCWGKCATARMNIIIW